MAVTATVEHTTPADGTFSAGGVAAWDGTAAHTVVLTGLGTAAEADTGDFAAALGADDNYVTDAEKVVIGNTSGTNTGDQDLSSLADTLLTRPRIASAVWANRATHQTTAGNLVRFTDIGAYGATYEWTGAIWRPLNGSVILNHLGAPVSGIANTATIFLQTLLPAGSWQNNDEILVWLTAAKSGATDSGTTQVWIGTSGTTTSDVAILSGSNQLLSASQRTTGGWLPIKRISATTVQRLGNISVGINSYGSSTAGVAPGVVTVSDADANALWVSVSLTASSTNDTLTAQSARIELITP